MFSNVAMKQTQTHIEELLDNTQQVQKMTQAHSGGGGGGSTEPASF